MARVLLTGGTGLVGLSLARALAAEGRAVRALVRSVERARGLLPAKVECVLGDVTDAESVRRAVEDCDVVYHAAGLPEQWLRDAGAFQRVNADGTRIVAEAALAARVQRFVYTSTIDVFARTPGRAFDESRIETAPAGTAYQRSKQAADHHVAAALERGLPAVFLHPSGVYGPLPAASPGTNDLIADLARGKIPILLPGGLPLVYSDDVARGHLLAERDAPPGARFILSEAYHDLQQIARAVAERTGCRVPPTAPLPLVRVVAAAGELLSRLTRRPPLIPRGQLHFLTSHVVPSSRRAQDELGWKPQPFAEGLERTLAFLREADPAALG